MSGARSSLLLLALPLSLALSSCAGIQRLPASFFSEQVAVHQGPNRPIPGREVYARMALTGTPIQISEIGSILTEEGELLSWKLECLEKARASLQELLSEDRGITRKQFEALHIAGVDFLLADLAEHPEAQDRPTVRLSWWEEGDSRALLLRSVYDSTNPEPTLQCRILKPSTLERQIQQLK